jgi:ribosome-associated protein
VAKIKKASQIKGSKFKVKPKTRGGKKAAASKSATAKTARKGTLSRKVSAPRSAMPKSGKVKKATKNLPAAKKVQALKPGAIVSKTKLKDRYQAPLPEFVDQLRKAALKILDERQAEDIVTMNLTGRSSVADCLIVASGRASRQTAAIANYLREAFEKLGIRPVRVEGLPDGNWVLVDAGDIVVHLFRPEVRRYYDLESIWQRGSPVAARIEP